MKWFVYLSTILVIFSVSISAQENNCIFGNEAQKLVNKGMKLYQAAKNENKLIDAATQFEWALKYNPDCEKIYLVLANIYIEVGQSRSYNILKAKTYSKCEDIMKYGTQYFIMARDRLDMLMEFNEDPNVTSEVQELLNDISVKENTLTGNYQLIICNLQLKNVKK